MPCALIIGHTGQDGQILWRQLAERGYSLIGVSSRETRCEAGPPGAPAVDIADYAQVHALLREHRPEQIYYLAARHHSSQESEPDQLLAWRESWSVHVHSFLNVLQAARETCPTVRVFYASSSRIFGPAITSEQDESTALKPACAYGVTKASAMLLANQFRVSHGIHVSCGVMFNHESPLRGSRFVSQRVVEGLVSIRFGSSAPLELGNLEARVDWGYAPDYTRAMQLILESGEPQDYVVATGQTHSVRDLVQVAADHLGLSWKNCVVEAAQLLTRPAQGLCGNAALLRRTTGWQPSVSFQQMIGIMVDAAVARREAGVRH